MSGRTTPKSPEPNSDPTSSMPKVGHQVADIHRATPGAPARDNHDRASSGQQHSFAAGTDALLVRSAVRPSTGAQAGQDADGTARFDAALEAVIGDGLTQGQQDGLGTLGSNPQTNRAESQQASKPTRDLVLDVQKRDRMRTTRRRRARAQQGLVEAIGASHRVARCNKQMRPSNAKAREQRPYAGQMELFRQPGSGSVYTGGFEHCYMMICPHCLAPVSAHIGQCMAMSIAEWAAAGNSTIFMSTGIPHHHGDTLVDALGVLDYVFALMLTKGRCRTIGALWDRLGGRVEYAAITEVMEGIRNGWAAGGHALVYVKGKPDPELVDEVAYEMGLIVAELMDTNHGWPHRADPSRLIQMEVVSDGRGLAKYLNKMGLEMTCIESKRGRSGETQSLMSMAEELGDLVAANNTSRRRYLLKAKLKEAYEALYGRDYLKTSRGWWSLVDGGSIKERNRTDIVDAGRKLQVTDRALLDAKAKMLAEMLGIEPGELEAMVNGEQRGSEQAEPIGVIWSDVVSDLDRVLKPRPDGSRRPFEASDVYVIEILRKQTYGLNVTICELIEDHGIEQAYRMLCATLRQPPPIWRDADGLLILSRYRPQEVGQWDLVEGWGMPEPCIELPDGRQEPVDGLVGEVPMPCTSPAAEGVLGRWSAKRQELAAARREQLEEIA